jgi:hypothetical protein
MTCAGCASTPSSKFYQLSPAKSQAGAKHEVVKEGAVTVAVGPLRLPDYLDRPQIVTRSGRNELHLSEFDRWAGSLDDDVTMVLVEDIANLLPAERFFVTRWSPLLENQLQSLYWVELLVQRFEGTPGGAVVLKAQWGLFSKDKRFILKRQADITEPVNGAGYEALVGAMSKALDRLSRDIADGILSVSPESGKK